MTERLDVNAGETYTIDAGETEEWLGADIDGTLEVNGTLQLIDDADPPTDDGDGDGAGFDVDTNPLDIPLGIDLPLSPLKLRSMEIGIAVFLVGTWGLLLGAAAFLQNYAAGILLFFAVTAALFSGLLNIGLELHWVMIAGTCLLLVMGMVVRWSR